MPQHVREEILATHDLSFVVIAGAGTGKTTLLIQKILALLRQGRATLPEIAAITFTEKAAAEIAVRLKDQLDRELAAGRDPDGRLQQARERIDGAAITTLHGFAGRLLRERPVEAGLPPDHQVQSPVQATLLFDALYDRWEEEQLSELRPGWHRLLEQGLAAQLKPLAWQLAQNLDILQDYPLSPPPTPDGLARHFLEVAEEVLSRLRRVLSRAGQPDDPAALQAREQLRILEGLSLEPRAPGSLAEDPESANLSEDRPLLALLEAARRLPLRARLGRKQAWIDPGALDEAPAITTALKEALEALEAGWADLLAHDAHQVLQGFLAHLQAEKRARGVVDFQDLLRMSRDLLRDRLDVRAYFQDRFKVLLVDEFQDTDPLQAEILFYLAEDGARAGHWRDVVLTPGKLFIVGDPKQSIYRFRRADVEVFDQVRARVVAQGGLERTLERNFRSQSGLVHFVNAFFGRYLHPPEDGGRYQPRYDPLTPVRAPSEAEPRVEVLIDVHDGAGPRGYSADEARAVEAVFVAGRLRRMLDGEALVADGEGRRHVRPGDVALLFRATTHLEVYTDALRDRDIPYRVIGSKRFFAAPEILDLTNLLRAIAAPQDTLALVAALRSPAFGLTDLEITWLARAGALDYRVDPDLSRVCATEDARRLLAHLEPIHARLRALHGLADRIPLSSMVARVLNATSLWPVAYASFAGEQKALNLEKVRGLARTYEAAGVRSLARFSERLLEAIAGRQQEEESSAAEEGDDVVRILTIHKAKGLEWPVVFLPGLMSAPDRTTGSFLEDREQGRFGFRHKEAATAAFAELQEREKPRLEAEALRLFYVAATRARDYLVLSGAHQERGADSMLQKLTDFLDERAGGEWHTQPRAYLQVGRPRQLMIEAEMSSSRRSLLDVVEQLEDPAVTALRFEIDASMRQFGEARAALTATAPALRWIDVSSRSMLLRYALPALDYQPFTPAAPPAARAATLVSHAAARLAHSHREVAPETRTEALRMLTSLLESPFYARIGRATELGRDMPVLYRIDEGLAIEGRIDLLIEEAGHLTIVGYATDAAAGNGPDRPLSVAIAGLEAAPSDDAAPVDPPRAADPAQERLEALGLAFAETSGVRPSRLLLYVLDRGELRELTVDEEMMTRTRARLTGSLRPGRQRAARAL